MQPRMAKKKPRAVTGVPIGRFGRRGSIGFGGKRFFSVVVVAAGGNVDVSFALERGGHRFAHRAAILASLACFRLAALVEASYFSIDDDCDPPCSSNRNRNRNRCE